MKIGKLNISKKNFIIIVIVIFVRIFVWFVLVDDIVVVEDVVGTLFYIVINII